MLIEIILPKRYPSKKNNSDFLTFPTPQYLLLRVCSKHKHSI